MIPKQIAPLLTASPRRYFPAGSSFYLAPTIVAAARISPKSFIYPKTCALSTTIPLSEAGGHGSDYDPPGGWLWGIRPGDKYEKEGWENIFFYGFYGSIALAMVAYAFKPDTT